MNHNFNPEQYAGIVNVYGSALRKIAPEAKIVACGQKRSNDLNWSQKVIDIAGDNFDILGCHNYEYENENFQSGLFKIENYLVKLRDFIRNSKHPDIRLAVLGWSLPFMRLEAGLRPAEPDNHEKLGELSMTCPHFLCRTMMILPGWLYFMIVSWFREEVIWLKSFREHFTEFTWLSIRNSVISKRELFFDDVLSKTEN
jgi:alpha-N-arabinofuranosidase